MLGFQVSLWDVRLYFFCWNIRHPTAVCIFFSSGQDFFPFFSSHRHPFPGIFSANRLCYGRRSALNLLTTPFVPRFPNSPLAKSFMGLFRFLYKVKCLSRADWRSLLGELWRLELLAGNWQWAVWHIMSSVDSRKSAEGISLFSCSCQTALQRV